MVLDFPGRWCLRPCDFLLDVQNAAFSNQSGEDTNLIGECGREPQRNLWIYHWLFEQYAYYLLFYPVEKSNLSSTPNWGEAEIALKYIIFAVEILSCGIISLLSLSCRRSCVWCSYHVLCRCFSFRRGHRQRQSLLPCWRYCSLCR